VVEIGARNGSTAIAPQLSKGAVHPSPDCAERLHLPTRGPAASKAGMNSRGPVLTGVMDFVLRAANQAPANCPRWAGNPVTAHWGCPSRRCRRGRSRTAGGAFRGRLVALRNRTRFSSHACPIESSTAWQLNRNADEIGRTEGPEDWVPDIGHEFKPEPPRRRPLRHCERIGRHGSRCESSAGIVLGGCCRRLPRRSAHDRGEVTSTCSPC